MTVPYTFGNANGVVALAELDANFAAVGDYANTAGTVTGNDQPNITSVGTLTSLSVLGNVRAGLFIGNIQGSLSNAVYASSAGRANTANTANTANFATLAGSTPFAITITGNDQPNITSVGTLTSLSVIGNISGNYILGNGYYLTGIANGGGGGNYDNSNVVALLSAFGSNTISTTGTIAGDGGLLSNISAANVSGAVANSTYAVSAVSAVSAATVTAATQPNITGVGTLTSLTAMGNIVTGGYFVGNFAGNISGNLVVPGSNTQIIYNNNGSANASANLTFNSSTGLLSVIGNISAVNIYGNVLGANVQGTVANATYAALSSQAITATTANYAAIANSVSGSNVSGAVANAVYAASAGNAFSAQTVTNSTQPAITGVGLLTALSVLGSVYSNGNIAMVSNVPRNTWVSASAPTSGQGNIGDIWYQTF